MLPGGGSRREPWDVGSWDLTPALPLNSAGRLLHTPLQAPRWRTRAVESEISKGCPISRRLLYARVRQYVPSVSGAIH